MPWDRWVLNATMGVPFCFCPVEGDLAGDFTIISGMNFMGSKPPGGKVVAIVHEAGQDAVDAFCAEHKAEIDALFADEAEAISNQFHDAS